MFERAAVSRENKSVRLREHLLDGMQNPYRIKNSPCISFQKNADNHSIRDELWISAALILHYSAYLTNLHKLSMNLYKDLLPTRQVKCSWDHITPAFVEADHWNQPQAIKQERGIILVTCNSGEPQKLHWGITLPTRHVFSNGILHLLRVLCKFLLHDCRSLGFRLCFSTLNIFAFYHMGC